MRRTDVLLPLLAALLLTGPLAAQVPDIRMNDAPFAILQGEGSVALAASVSDGLYPAGIGTARIGTAGIGSSDFQTAESLVAAFYQRMRAGDKAAVVALFDDSSRVAAERKIDISAAADAYSRLRDVSLVSKATFGDVVRLRFELLRRDSDTSFPWVLETRRIGGRYYITETLPQTNLFVEVASAHPYNYEPRPYTPARVDGLTAIGFQQAGSEVRASGSSGGASGLTLYLRLSWLSDPAARLEAAGALSLLEGMRSAFADNDEGKFIALWDPAERKRITSAENYKVIFMSQQHFYSQVDSLRPVAFVKAGAQMVLYYYPHVAGERLELQALPMRLVGGRYMLTSRLDEYYAWQILSNPQVKAAIAEREPR